MEIPLETVKRLLRARKNVISSIGEGGSEMSNNKTLDKILTI